MMDFNKLLKDKIGKAMEKLPVSQRVEVNRMISKLGKVMDESTVGDTPEERYRSMEKAKEKILSINKEMLQKDGFNSNK